MLSRALMTATVMLLIGCFTAIPVRAENLEAGKSPSQIFAGTCSACHKGTRGLIKTVSPGSLPGFLRQHYTTSADMAGLLSSYLLSNGATDTRMGGGLTKQGKDAKSEPKPAAESEQAEPRLGHRQRPGVPPQEAARPDTDGRTARGEPRGEPKGEPKGEPAAHPGRNARRLARPGPDTPEPDKPAVAGEPPATAATDTGPDRRPLAKRKLSKRGRPGREEPPKTDAVKTDAVKTDAAKTEPGKDEPSKGEAAKTETPKDTLPKDDGTRTGASTPADEGKAEATKTEGAKPEAAKGEAGAAETPLRADPVPAVTPAPKPSEGEPKPVQTATPSPAASAPPATSGNGSELWRALAPSARPMPPATEATAPPPAPATSAGPPAPPISQ
jgi:hypothetical protein